MTVSVPRQSNKGISLVVYPDRFDMILAAQRSWFRVMKYQNVRFQICLNFSIIANIRPKYVFGVVGY
jgi:hypothetical protein